jgi:hypothetical protein
MRDWRMAMRHVDEAILTAYLDGELGQEGVGSGELGAETIKEIEAHLAGCAECSALFEEVKRLRYRASEILSSSTPVDIEIPPFEEIRARSKARSSGSRALQLSRIKKLAWAATVVLAVAVGWYARGTVVTGSGELGAGNREQMTAPQPTTTASRPDEERAGSGERAADTSPTQEPGTGSAEGKGQDELRMAEEAGAPAAPTELSRAREPADRDVSGRGAVAESVAVPAVTPSGVVAGVPSRAEPEAEAKAAAEDRVARQQRIAEAPQAIAQQVAAENVARRSDAVQVGGVLLFADVGWTDVNEAEARRALGGEVPIIEELPVIDYAVQRQPSRVVVRVRQRLESDDVVELLATRSADKDVAERPIAAANESAEREEPGRSSADFIVIQVRDYTVVLHGGIPIEKLRELGKRVR